MSTDTPFESTHGLPVAVTDTTAHSSDATTSGVPVTAEAPTPAPPPNIANLQPPAAAASCLAVPAVSPKASSEPAKPAKAAKPSTPADADTSVAHDTQDTPSLLERANAVVGEVKALDPQSFPNPPGPRNVLPCTLQNTAYLLGKYQIDVRYNVIKKRCEIILPRHQMGTDNSEASALTHIISLAAANGMNTQSIPSFVEALADLNPYNPVAQWILSRAWDGKDRIADIVATLETREGFSLVLKRALIYRWLLSAVAAALKPKGFKARGVLTLQGPQGCGKTSWAMALVSDPALREMVIRIDHHLDPNNKDSVLTAVSHWVVEIGELDSSFRKDVARLKGFLTSDQDKLRRPYAKSDSEYSRRSVFCATVNENNFLIDMTGNARFWSLPLVRVQYNHTIDMQQLYAQLAVDYAHGAQWWLTPDEEALLEVSNRAHRAISAIQEMLAECLDLEQKAPKWTNLAAIEVLKLVGLDKPTNPQCRECAAILRDLFGEPKKHRGIYKWRVPLKPFSPEDEADEASPEPSCSKPASPPEGEASRDKPAF